MSNSFIKIGASEAKALAKKVIANIEASHVKDVNVYDMLPWYKKLFTSRPYFEEPIWIAMTYSLAQGILRACQYETKVIISISELNELKEWE